MRNIFLMKAQLNLIIFSEIINQGQEKYFALNQVSHCLL